MRIDNYFVHRFYSGLLLNFSVIFSFVILSRSAHFYIRLWNKQCRLSEFCYRYWFCVRTKNSAVIYVSLAGVTKSFWFYLLKPCPNIKRFSLISPRSIVSATMPLRSRSSLQAKIPRLWAITQSTPTMFMAAAKSRPFSSPTRFDNWPAS